MAEAVVRDVLLLEYKEMRQELRDLINSMNVNLQVAILAVVATIGWSVSTGNRQLLYALPTILFAFITVHLLKTSAANVLDTYCQVVSAKIRRHIHSEERILDWEGGVLWEQLSGPTSIVQAGFYLFFLVVAVLFMVLSWQAYSAYKWTGIVHGTEASLALGYAIAAIRWNRGSERAKWLEKYGLPSA